MLYHRSLRLHAAVACTCPNSTPPSHFKKKFIQPLFVIAQPRPQSQQVIPDGRLERVKMWLSVLEAATRAADLEP